MTFTPLTFVDIYPDFPEGYKVRCGSPDCNRAVWPWLLQDMRAIPGVVGDFICDGCRSHLKRFKIPIDGGEAPATRAEWATRLLEAHNAPVTAVVASLAFRKRSH